MSLLNRVDRIERKHVVKGRTRLVMVSEEELEAKKAELRASPDFNPDDELVFFVFTDDPNAELVRSIDA